jgi:hypothetical protein
VDTGHNECWLVVEAKRPDKTLDEARDQAHSYARELKAPFYVVLNGRRLIVYERGNIGPDFVRLDIALDPATLLARRNEIEGALGHFNVKQRYGLLTKKRLTQFQDSLTVVQQLREKWMPQTVWVDVQGTKVRWCGPLPDESQLSLFSGSPGAALPANPIELTVDAEFSEIADVLRAALIRLALHGGISVLRVREPVRWRRQAVDQLTNCLGLHARGWLPVESAQQARWAICPVEGAPPDLGAAPSFAQDLLAEHIHAAMDTWTERALVATVEGALSSNDPSTRGGLEIEPDYRQHLALDWPALKGQLDPVHAAFSTAALSARHGRDRWAARLRLGPRAVLGDGCMITGVLLLLVFRDFLRVNASPDVSPCGAPDEFPINLMTSGMDGHLLCLQRLAARDMDVALLDVIGREPLLLLVPWTSRDPVQLSQLNWQARPLGRGSGHTLITPSFGTVLSIGFTPELKSAIAQGRGAAHACLADYAKQVASILYPQLVSA